MKNWQLHQNFSFFLFAKRLIRSYRTYQILERSAWARIIVLPSWQPKAL